MRIGIFISVLFLFQLISCTYSPEGSYFEEIEKKTPGVSISLNDYPDKDTIYVFQVSSFKYIIELPDVAVKEVKVSMGGTVLSNTQETNGSFIINENNLITGIYELKIEITTGTASGSLADKLDKEVVTLWRSWVLSIDVTEPTKPVIQTSNENGFLKISWTPHLRKNFLNYAIYMGYNGSRKVVQIDDPHVNYYIDSTRLWLDDTYSVGVQTYNHSVFSDPLIGNEGFRINVENHSSDSTAVASWNRISYPGAFKKIVIYENNLTRSAIDRASDTTITIKLSPVLGKTTTLLFQVLDKYRQENYNLVAQTGVFFDNPLEAKRTFPNQQYYYSSALKKTMALTNNPRLRILDSDMKVIDSLDFNGGFYLPFPGEFVYIYNGQTIQQINLSTKEIKQLSPIGKSGLPLYPLQISVAHNGYVSYTGIDYYGINGPRFISAVKDINSGQLLKMTDSYYVFGSPYPNEFNSLSDDGQFAQKQMEIIDLRNGSYNSLGTLNGTGYEFRPDNSGQLIFKNSFPIEIFKTIDQTKIKSLPQLPAGYLIKNYDPVTKNIFFANDQSTRIYLVNVDTGIVTETDCLCSHFYNGTLFTQNGYYLKIM